jgi:hypothetical protein
MSIDQKLDEIKDMIHNLHIMAVRQTEQISNAASRADSIEEDIEKLEIKHTEEIEPIKKHIARVEGAAKLIGMLALLVGIVGGIIKWTS